MKQIKTHLKNIKDGSYRLYYEDREDELIGWYNIKLCNGIISYDDVNLKYDIDEYNKKYDRDISIIDFLLLFDYDLYLKK